MISKPVRRVFGILIFVSVVVLFGQTLMRNWENIRDIEVSIFPEAFIAVGIFAAAVMFSGVLWGMNLRFIAGNVITSREAVRIHVAAWLLKYIPGQAGSLIYKLAWAKRNNISRAQVALSFVYENILLTFASTIPVIPIILLTVGDRSNNSLPLVLLVFSALPILLSSSLLDRLIQKAMRSYTKSLAELKLYKLSQLLWMTLLYLGPRIVNAIGFLVVASSFLTVTPSLYIPLSAIYIFAGIVGIYAIFVPSGLGVREAVIVVFASAYFSPEQAIVLSLLARFYATVADGLLALLFAYMTKGRIFKTI